MTSLKSIIIISIFASLLGTASAEEIKVKSVERQNGQQSLEIVKQSGGSQEQTKDTSHKAKQAAPSLTLSQRSQAVGNPDFWIYDAYVTLNVDEDFDGYYSDFTVEFDADSVYEQATVYARLYLSRGDVFEEYHTTSLFDIQGDSSDDAFVVQSELLTGFPPGDYEVLIELYDAFDDSLVAIFDGNNDADLTFLSLESKSYEESEQRIIIVEEGGSLGYLMLLTLPLLVLRRIGWK